MPRFLQVFPNLVPTVWLPYPSFGTSLEVQSAWPLSSGCAGMQHVDTAGSVLETSPHIPLLLSNTDVFCLEVGADGMNSFISTAQTQNRN